MRLRFWFIISAIVGLGGFAYEGLTLYEWGLGKSAPTVIGIELWFLGAVATGVALGYFVKNQGQTIES